MGLKKNYTIEELEGRTVYSDNFLFDNDVLENLALTYLIFFVETHELSSKLLNIYSKRSKTLTSSHVLAKIVRFMCTNSLQISLLSYSY